MQYRFVIIGYGTMGFTHIKKLTALGEEIAGIVDIDPIARDEATEAGLHVYAHLADALADPTVDVVFICTPNEVHKSIALAALAAGKNVITEKPAMLSVDEIQEVMAAEAASGKVFIVHQNRRWDEDYLVMKELCTTPGRSATSRTSSPVSTARAESPATGVATRRVAAAWCSTGAYTSSTACCSWSRRR